MQYRIIVRVLEIGGYSADVLALKTTGSLASVGGALAAEGFPELFGKTLAILAPTRLGGITGGNVSDGQVDQTVAPLTSSLIEISGSTAMSKTISFNTGSESYIDKLIPDPQNNTLHIYLYKNFKSFHGDITGKITGSFNSNPTIHRT